MSFYARVYRVFIATPGDVRPEREQIKEAILKMNENYAENAFFSPVMYEFLPPLGGKVPQNYINRVALDSCDILIALFWTKVGKGTIEELRRHISAGKFALCYRLDNDGTIPTEIIKDEQKRSDYLELERFFKDANTVEGNEFGLYRTVNVDNLFGQVEADIRNLSPILAEMDDAFPNESVVESDWLSEIDDDAMLAEVIPQYKVNVSRNLVLKLFDQNKEDLYSKVLWDEVLVKFCGKNGDTNLARTLLGIANRKKTYHYFFAKGIVQLHSRKKWLFTSLMKKIHASSPEQFHSICGYECMKECDVEGLLRSIESEQH